MSQSISSSDIRIAGDEDDPFAFCRENPDALREVEEYARKTGRDEFAAACRDVLRKIGAEVSTDAE